MKVSEFADDLELPASVVLEQCARLGLAASWAGAELSTTDMVVLRAELASDDAAAGAGTTPGDGSAPGVGSTPIALDDADGPVRAAARAASTDRSPVASEPGSDPSEPVPAPADLGSVTAEAPTEALPGAPSVSTDPPAVPSDAPADPADAPSVPTGSPAAVGSIPTLAAELTAPSVPPAPAGRLPGGIGGAPSPAAATAPSPDGPRPASSEHHHTRRFDPSLRPAVLGSVVAGLAFVGSNSIGHPVAIGVLWLVVIVGLIAALLAGNRARYHITNHPDQRKGLPIALVALLVALAATVGFGATVYSTFRSQPLADAPMDIGKLSSAQHARWAYQRVLLVKDNGWHRPAKDVGTCWEATGDPREVDHRVEVGGPEIDCRQSHGYEVIGLYGVDKDADSPYPGEEALTAYALDRCKTTQERLQFHPAGLQYLVEYPTEAGWDDADHDVTCVAAALSDRSLR